MPACPVWNGIKKWASLIIQRKRNCRRGGRADENQNPKYRAGSPFSFRRESTKDSSGEMARDEPKLLMLDEPTRGIDIGAKREIYKLMEKLAGKGIAILFVSSEMEEVLGNGGPGLCDARRKNFGRTSKESNV